MSLCSNEHVIYSTRLSKRLFVKPLLFLVVCLAVVLIFWSFAAQYAAFMLWALIVVAVGLVIATVTRYFSSEFVVTDQRVLIHHGFLARTSYEMVLKKIESITVNQTLSDRFIWGSGTLVITGTGGTKEEFPNVGKAVAFQEHLNEALHAI